MSEDILNHTQSLEVNNAGIRIHVRHLPNKGKPALVALHGLTTDGSCWLRLAEELHNDFDIVMPDARGHGQSDAPPSGYTAKDHASDAAAVIRTMGLGPCVVIGHSMGGVEATQLAADYPELVRALILEDPAWHVKDLETEAQKQVLAKGWRAELGKNQAMGYDALLDMTFKAHPHWVDLEAITWTKATLLARSEALNFLTEPMHNWRELASKIACPTLLITVDAVRGGLVDDALVAEARARMTRLRVAHVPLAGHDVRRDNWESYSAHIKAFLAELS